jgi:hypothetical protein
MGHYKTSCPRLKTENGATMAQAPSKIPKEWVLIDSQSTLHLFNNSELLTNIQKTSTTMRIASNGGYSSPTMQGEYDGFGRMWYDPNAIANILSLALVQDEYRVWFDSQDSTAAFYVDMREKGILKFKQSSEPRGLYHYDTSIHNQPDQQIGTVMVRTVDDRRAKYSDHDYQRAVEAREIQGKIGFPSLRQYLRVVSKGQLPDFPPIFGPSMPCLKGKTERNPSPRV